MQRLLAVWFWLRKMQWIEKEKCHSWPYLFGGTAEDMMFAFSFDDLVGHVFSWSVDDADGATTWSFVEVCCLLLSCNLVGTFGGEGNDEVFLWDYGLAVYSWNQDFLEILVTTNCWSFATPVDFQKGAQGFLSCQKNAEVFFHANFWGFCSDSS